MNLYAIKYKDCEGYVTCFIEGHDVEDACDRFWYGAEEGDEILEVYRVPDGRRDRRDLWVMEG